MEDENVILEIEGDSITCNKEELAKESAYFEVMFTRDFLEKNKNTIQLKVFFCDL